MDKPEPADGKGESQQKGEAPKMMNYLTCEATVCGRNDCVCRLAFTVASQRHTAGLPTFSTVDEEWVSLAQSGMARASLEREADELDALVVSEIYRLS